MGNILRNCLDLPHANQPVPQAGGITSRLDISADKQRKDVQGRIVHPFCSWLQPKDYHQSFHLCAISSARVFLSNQVPAGHESRPNSTIRCLFSPQRCDVIDCQKRGPEAPRQFLQSIENRVFRKWFSLDVFGVTVIKCKLFGFPQWICSRFIESHWHGHRPSCFALDSQLARCQHIGPLCCWFEWIQTSRYAAADKVFAQ